MPICPINLHTSELGYDTPKKVRKFRKKLVKKLIKHQTQGKDYFQIVHFLEGYLMTDVVVVNIKNEEQEKAVHQALNAIGFIQSDGMGSTYICPPKD